MIFPYLENKVKEVEYKRFPRSYWGKMNGGVGNLIIVVNKENKKR